MTLLIIISVIALLIIIGLLAMGNKLENENIYLKEKLRTLCRIVGFNLNKFDNRNFLSKEIEEIESKIGE
jgi:hypothetical protein